MAHCTICRRDFASGNSLRSHRSRFLRSDTETVQIEEESQETNQTSSQETNQMNSQESKQMNSHETSQHDTLDEEPKDDTLSGKRKHEDTENDPYLPKNKDRNIYKKLSSIHDILKTNLEKGKTVFNFFVCYVMKQEFDRVIPDIFDSELTMKQKLTYEQFQYITMIRELPNFLDIHMVVNEAENQELLLGILKIIDDIN